MLDDVGFLDERLFMYYEDLDLCWRAQRRGWRFVYEPKAVVRHVHCGSSGEWSPFFCFHVERNRVLVNLKNNSLILALLVLIGFMARFGRAWYRIVRQRNRGPVRMAHGLAYGRAALSILRWLPAMLLERRRIRAVRRVPNLAIRHSIEPVAAKAA
jgi:GT2 family glycosyltransferase